MGQTPQHTAIYVRISTKDQKLDRQVSDCKQELTQSQLDNYKVYADQGSGYNADRPQFQELNSEIEAGNVDMVVTTEISRISRNAAIFTQFLDLCTENGTGLKTLQTGFPTIEPDGRFGKLIGQIMAAVAEMEWEMTKDRIKSGVNEAQRQGKWTSRPPKGFTTNEEGYLQVKNDEYLTVVSALEEIETTDKSIYAVARASGISDSTLRDIYNDPEKRQLYLRGEADDDLKQEALDNADVQQGDIKQLWDEIEAVKDQLEATADE